MTMVHSLKHIALRLWTTILVGGLAILWFLPLTGYRTEPAFTIAPAVIILAATFMLVGALFNRIGARTLREHLRVAADHERSGDFKEAEAVYGKALAVFDSFLFSSSARKKLSADLAEPLARFTLARTDRSSASEALILSYLNDHPGDPEMAELWLHQVGGRGWLEKAHEDLAVRIGDAQPEHPAIQELLARYYVMEERTDFAALQTYRRALDTAESHAIPTLSSEISRLFLQEKRADEWALQAYLCALEHFPDREDLLAGIAASLAWVRPNERNRKWIAAGRRHVERIDESRLVRMRSGFRFPDPERPADRFSKRPKPSFSLPAAKTLERISAAIGKALSAGAKALAGFFRRFAASPKARRVVAGALLAAAAVGAVFLIINTAGHLLRFERRTDTEAATSVPAARFTIQVAAYLKEEHARQFADELKQKGIEDVFWTQASRNQKTWYQVRVSRFPDKESARAYGESLKARGLIEDFYIANYDAPPG